MLYLRRTDYRHIPYMHDVDNGGAPPERRNVATSGCGLCCLSMIVDHLTTESLGLAEAVRLSETNGANRKPGTNMLILGPIVAQLYDLEMTISRDPEEMVRHLQTGDEVIVNVRRGDRPVGLFTQRGHYMLLISTDGKDVCILDSDYREGKFDKEGQQGKVQTDDAPFLYCSIETLMEEVPKSDPAFYMFKRKQR